MKCALVLLILLPFAAAAQTRIMPLGDSITQGNQEHASYRRELWMSLKAAGYDVDFVGSETLHRGGPGPFHDFDQDHEGHWGWRTDQILEHLGAWAKNARPDIVLVHLGDNDIFWGQGVTNALSDLAQVVATLREVNPAVTILMAQVLPTSRTPEVNKLSSAIPALAARLGTPESRVLAIDQWTGFDPATDTYDGLHPNARGEKKVAARWFEALKSVLPPP